MPSGRVSISDGIQQLAAPDEDLLCRLGVDTRGLWARTSHSWPFRDTDDGRYLSHRDEWGLTYQRDKEASLWYDLVVHPLAGGDLSSDLIASHNWPFGGDPSRFRNLREKATAFRKAGYAVVMKSVCAGLLEMAIRLRGMEAFLTDLLLNRKEAEALIDRILQVKIEFWERGLSEVGDLVDIIAEGDDYGTQQSQLVSPAMFKDIFKPRQAELIDFVKKRAPHAYFFFHSCGNVRPLLPDFIEIGIDIVNPVQTSAPGMAASQLKQDFGTDLVFWGGGVDTQEILPRGNPEQVRDDVRRRLDILAPGGGFVFCTIHNIQADVPPENIIAMYETLEEFGRY